MAIVGILLFIYGAAMFMVPAFAYRGVSRVQRLIFGRRPVDDVPSSVMLWVEMREEADRYDRRATRWIRVHGITIAAAGAVISAYYTVGLPA